MIAALIVGTAILVGMAVPVTSVPLGETPLSATTTTTTLVPATVCRPTSATETPIVWKQSVALGRPTRGKLRNGVQLPTEGSMFATWDPGTKSVRSAGWRRWGTDHLISHSLCAIESFAAGRPVGARILLGDISLPEGGQFGPEYGGLGHASHQNGLDIDVYYPRKDGAETVVGNVKDIDRVATQALINEFIRYGATVIFVGRGIGLTDTEGIVKPARKHLDHFHVRFAPRGA
jgi:murein endopeptidase